MSFGDDTVVTTLQVSVPHAVGVREASRIVYGYMDVLRSTRLVRNVTLETPGPVIKRVQDRRERPTPEAPRDRGLGTGGRHGHPTAERGERLGRDVQRVRRRRATRQVERERTAEEVWFLFKLRVEAKPPWQGVETT